MTTLDLAAAAAFLGVHRLAPSYVSQFAGNARPVGAVRRKKAA